MTRPKQLLTLAVATLATSTPWPRLDEALANYPSIHARETAKIKNGDKTAKFVLVVCYHGLGNRHHALVSAFALALARDAALYVDWPDQRCNKWAQSGDAAACEAYSQFGTPSMLPKCLSTFLASSTSISLNPTSSAAR